jgi:hypothetical protein
MEELGLIVDLIDYQQCGYVEVYQERPDPKECHTKKPTPQGPTRARVRSTENIRRRLGEDECLS